MIGDARRASNGNFRQSARVCLLCVPAWMSRTASIFVHWIVGESIMAIRTRQRPRKLLSDNRTIELMLEHTRLSRPRNRWVAPDNYPRTRETTSYPGSQTRTVSEQIKNATTAATQRIWLLFILWKQNAVIHNFRAIPMAQRVLGGFRGLFRLCEILEDGWKFDENFRFQHLCGVAIERALQNLKTNFSNAHGSMCIVHAVSRNVIDLKSINILTQNW